MTLLAKSMEVVFIVAMFVALAAHIYASRYFLPMWWTGFRKNEKHRGYMRNALIGYGAFIGAVAIGFAAGGIADHWGGGWH